MPKLRRERRIDFVIADGENSARGAGFSASTVSALLDAGLDAITSGDHVWTRKHSASRSSRVRQATCG